MPRFKSHAEDVSALTFCGLVAATLWTAAAANAAYKALRYPLSLILRFVSMLTFVAVVLLDAALNSNPLGALLGVAFGIGAIGYVAARSRSARISVQAAAMFATSLAAVGLFVMLDIWADGTTAAVSVLLLAGAAGLVRAETARLVGHHPMTWGWLLSASLAVVLFVLNHITPGVKAAAGPR